MKHPLARTTGLVAIPDGDDVIVQTREGLELARLSAYEARIWRAADGLTGVQQLASQALSELAADYEGGREEVVWQALDRLGDLGLLETRAAPPGAIPFMSRRNLLTRAASASVASVAAVVASDAFLAAAAAETNANSATCISRAEEGGVRNRVESVAGARAEEGGLTNRVESVTASRAEPGGVTNRVEAARGAARAVRPQQSVSQVGESGGDGGSPAASECTGVTLPEANTPPR